jgi:hypothetical protein
MCCPNSTSLPRLFVVQSSQETHTHNNHGRGPAREAAKEGVFLRKKEARPLLNSLPPSSRVNKKLHSRPSSRSSEDEVEHNEAANCLQLQGQKKKITKKELLSALKKTKKEVEEKQLLLAASQKKCSQIAD